MGFGTLVSSYKFTHTVPRCMKVTASFRNDAATQTRRPLSIHTANTMSLTRAVLISTQKTLNRDRFIRNPISKKKRAPVLTKKRNHRLLPDKVEANHRQPRNPQKHTYKERERDRKKPRDRPKAETIQITEREKEEKKKRYSPGAAYTDNRVKANPPPGQSALHREYRVARMSYLSAVPPAAAHQSDRRPRAPLIIARVNPHRAHFSRTRAAHARAVYAAQQHLTRPRSIIANRYLCARTYMCARSRVAGRREVCVYVCAGRACVGGRYRRGGGGRFIMRGGGGAGRRPHELLLQCRCSRGFAA